MVFSGILSGLAAATCFSLAYLLSKLFYEKSGKGPLHLLAISNMQMGGLALLCLPFIWTDITFSVSILGPLLGVIFFGLGGQAVFFLTLKHAPPSQVTPLLALKILLLAFASIVILGREITLLQWLSIFMCFSATFLLHFSGAPIPLKSFIGMLITCIGYALGDVFVTMLIRQFIALGVTNPVLVALGFVYAASGIVGVLLGIWLRKDIRAFPIWKFAGYFSMVFFWGDLAIFTTFKLVGPVFGNILLSTRGIISIILAKIVTMHGLNFLEHDMTRSVVVRRLLAASLFSSAIALYVISA